MEIHGVFYKDRTKSRRSKYSLHIHILTLMWDGACLYLRIALGHLPNFMTLLIPFHVIPWPNE